MLIKKIKVALGIIAGRVFTGPIEVSLDLTRNCSVGCIMCWYWSPLLKNPPSQEWLNKQIDYNIFLQLVKDFKRLQVKRVILGGQGEPLLYPKIFEVIETLKKNGFEVSLITAGVHLNDYKTKNLFELGVDHIDFSLQTAAPITYLKIHPNQKEGTLERIKSQIQLLSELKKKFNRKTPKIQIINVICNLNYQDTVKIVELAKEVGAESIGIKRIDVIPETRELLLNNSQLDELKDLFKDAKEKAKQFGIETSMDFYQEFILQGLTTGVYTSTYYSQIPCYVGWVTSRILSDGNVVPCCGCYDVILGNINHNSFKEIWYSQRYQNFRRESINLNKSDLMGRGCKCYSCIDFEFNLGIYHKLHPFGT
ncbi:MAG: radical SAM protein [Candidatus Omnitrophota bacterium]|nr:radical SAM protein [Candidatus Omnitrophota bacterium]